MDLSRGSSAWSASSFIPRQGLKSFTESERGTWPCREVAFSQKLNHSLFSFGWSWVQKLLSNNRRLYHLASLFECVVMPALPQSRPGKTRRTPQTLNWSNQRGMINGNWASLQCQSVCFGKTKKNCFDPINFQVCGTVPKTSRFFFHFYNEMTCMENLLSKRKTSDPPAWAVGRWSMGG